MTDEPQDVAEALDDETTGGDDRLADEDLAYDPPDEPLVVDRGGDEARPDQIAESLAERVAREEPEVGAGRLGDDDREADGEIGALLGDAGALDVEADLVGRSVGRARGEVIPAEEAAVHLTAEPPLHPLGDGYVDTDDDLDGPATGAV